MKNYFLVLIFLSEQIFGLSETQFDRLYNKNYHSKSRNVSPRFQESLETLKISDRKSKSVKLLRSIFSYFWPIKFAIFTKKTRRKNQWGAIVKLISR